MSRIDIAVRLGSPQQKAIAGYEAMNIIRKGQIRELPKTDVVGQAPFIAHYVRYRSLTQ